MIRKVINLDLIVLVSFLLLPKFQGVDLTIIPMAFCAIYVCVLRALKNGRGDKIGINKNILAISILMLCIVTISCISFCVNLNDIVPEFMLKPLRVAIIMLILWFYMNERSITGTDAVRIIIYASLVDGVIIFAQYFADAYFGLPDFLVSSDFKLRAITPYRKP